MSETIVPVATTRFYGLLAVVVVLSGCSNTSSGQRVDGSRVRAAVEKELGTRFVAVPNVMETATLSNVLDIYSTGIASERILIVVFDTPAATGQIVGDRGRIQDTEVIRRGNVVILYTPAVAAPPRTDDLRRALARAFAS